MSCNVVSKSQQLQNISCFKIFTHCILLPLSDVGARNERRLCAVTYNKSSEFEVLQGLLDRVMQLLEVPFGGPEETSYRLKPADGQGALLFFFL